MPRIYTSNNDPLDFCLKYFPKNPEKAFALYGNLGDGPDGRGNCFDYDSDHPSYEDDYYYCEKCGKILEAEDDLVPYWKK